MSIKDEACPGLVEAGWVLRVLLLAGLSASLAPSAAAAVRLSFNGIPYTPASGEILLAPGTENRLTVEPTSNSLQSPLLVTLVRESPTREKYRDQRPLHGQNPRTEFRLGPLAAPPVYEYDDGMTFVRGYALSVRVEHNGEVLERWDFQQTLARPDLAPHPYPWWQMEDVPARHLRFVKGGGERIPYDLKSRSLGPLSVRLGESVLDNQDDLRVQVRLNHGETPANLDVRLRVVAPDGREIWNRKSVLRKSEGWKTETLSPATWPAGDYRVELLPETGGTLWPDGPMVTYRRRAVNPNTVAVSPLAPWTLDRDPGRAEINVTDFRAAHRKWGVGRFDPLKWKWREAASGPAALEGLGDFRAPPVAYRFPLKGSYAIFARSEGAAGIFVQAGQQGLVRLVRPNWRGTGTFLEAADLTNAEVRIYSNGQPGGVLASLRLVPVTNPSVQRFYQETGHPPTPMYAVNDWADNFGSDGSYRLLPDQFDVIACTEAELGSRSIGWSIGRSWVEYHSKLEHARTFPCVPYEAAKKSPHYPPDDPYDYGPRIRMMQQYDPLDIVYRSRKRCGGEIWPWLSMQRHYGANFYGGMFACPFYVDHPRWWRFAKDGAHAAGVSYFFPEVRKERIDILLEVAARGADGLVVGCDRQVPMLLYDPAMVEAYLAKTGVDPRRIDASHGRPYEDWVRWRAGFFTQLLRDLKRELAPLRASKGRRIPVAVRFPSAGIFLNLAQGIDIETWCREALIDRMQLDPLEDLAGKGIHDVRPYLELGRRYGIPVIGGIGSTGYLGDPTRRPSHIVAGLKRAIGLLRSGVDGIDTYETNGVALGYEGRFLLPLFGNAKRLEYFIKNSNIEACYPVDAGNAAAGHDNHSRWDKGWSVEGFGRNSL